MGEVSIDEVDKQLIVSLGKDARVSASALASEVGMTRQAVTERLERLRQNGVIQRYTVAVDPEKLGRTVRAFIAITLLPACTDAQEQAVIALLRQSPWVQECYRVTGDDYFQVRVVASDIADVRGLLLALRGTRVVQSTRTYLALETLFEKTSSVYLEEETG